MTSLYDIGERRHETCRYGRLTSAWEVPCDGGELKPTCIPLCSWNLPEVAPPGVARSWGGAVEFERDCAVCEAHQEIEVAA